MSVPKRLFAVLTEFPTRRSFGAVIASRRQEMELSKREVARHVGFTDSMLARIELNERNPDIKYLPALARKLNIELSALSLLFLRSRAPHVYAAFIRTPSAHQNKLDALPPAVQETVLKTIDKLYNQERERRTFRRLA